LSASLGDFEGGDKRLVRIENPTMGGSVVVYLSQAGVAVGVEAHHAVEIDRGGVRVDDAAPRDLGVLLP